MEFNPNRPHSTASNTQVPNKLLSHPSHIQQSGQKHPAPLQDYASTGSNHLAQAGSKPLSNFSISSPEKEAEKAAKDPSTDTRIFIREILSGLKLDELNDENSFQSAKDQFESLVKNLEGSDIPDEHFHCLREEADAFRKDLTRFFRFRTPLHAMQSSPISNEEDLGKLQNTFKMLEGRLTQPQAKHAFFSSVWEEFNHFKDSMHLIQSTQEKFKSIENNSPKIIQDIEALAPSLKQLQELLESSLDKLKDSSNLKSDFPKTIKERLAALSNVFQAVCNAQLLLNTLALTPTLDEQNLTQFQESIKMLVQKQLTTLEDLMVFLQKDFGSAEAFNTCITTIKKEFETRLDHIQNPPPQAEENYSKPVIKPQDNAALKQFYETVDMSQQGQFAAILRQKILSHIKIIPKGCDLLNGTLTIRDMSALSAIHTINPQSYKKIVLANNDIDELPETIKHIKHVESIEIHCSELKSLRHIDLCTGLKQLYINRYCSKITDFTTLNLCSSIKSIRINPFHYQEGFFNTNTLPPHLERLEIDYIGTMTPAALSTLDEILKK